MGATIGPLEEKDPVVIPKDRQNTTGIKVTSHVVNFQKGRNAVMASSLAGEQGLGEAPTLVNFQSGRNTHVATPSS